VDHNQRCRQIAEAVWRHLNEDQQARIQGLIPADASTREILREVLVGVLPIEPVERTALLVQFAYFVRELNDEALADTFRNVDEPPLEAVYSGILGDAEKRGEIVQGLDLAREADTLLAISGGSDRTSCWAAARP